jgi:lysophospholipase L1-like esterase
MNIKYILGVVLSIPLLPILYFQGKKVRQSVPTLPEATGTEGFALVNSEKTIRLITIGESTVAGIGVETHEEGFSGTLAKELATKLSLNVSWKVFAKSGFTAKQICESIVPQITEKEIDLIVIGTGGNDVFTLNIPSYWKKNIQRLIDDLRLKYPKTPIVFLNMPPIKEFPAFTKLMKFVLGNLVEILGEELAKQIKNQEKVFYYSEVITLETWTKVLNLDANTSDFFSDGVHPSKLTYQSWAKYFAEYLVSNNLIIKLL